MIKPQWVHLKNKLLFIHYGGGIGGAPISMLQLVSLLDKKKYEPIIVFTSSGPIVDLAISKGFKTKVVPLKSAFFYSDHVRIRFRMLYKLIINYKSTIMSMINLIKKEKPDIIYLNTSVIIPVAIGVKKENIPLLWHIRETPGPNKFIRKWQIGLIKKLADRAIVTSDYVAGIYGESKGFHTIHNAVDLERFDIDTNKARKEIRSEFEIPLGSPVICMIGSVQEVKGHFLLVQAARKIVKSKPEVRFLIIAGGVDGKYRKSWKGRVKSILGLPFDELEKMKRNVYKTGLGEYFIYTGYRQDIPELLSASDIVVFLSQKAEGFGRPLIEGMAMGKPVVATNIGPSREILGKESGVLVPVGDVNKTADAVLRLIDNPKICKEMGNNGRQRVEEHFDLKRHVSAIQKCIDQTIS